MRYFVSRMGRAVLYDAIQCWRFESSIDSLPISKRFLLLQLFERCRKQEILLGNLGSNPASTQLIQFLHGAGEALVDLLPFHS